MDFLNDKENLIKLLQYVQPNTIEDVKIEGIDHFDNIMEYDFSLLKTIVIYKSGKKDEIYLKMIKGGKIKESIFCYWSLLYDEFTKDNQDNEEDLVQKAIITQITANESTSCLLLTVNSKLNYIAEINLIELRNLAKINKNYERWLDSLEIKSGDILFIGKKLY